MEAGGGVRRAELEGLCLNQESKFTLHKPALALVPWPGTSGELDLLGYLFSFSIGNHPAFRVPQSKSHPNCPLSSSTPVYSLLLQVNLTLLCFAPQEALQRELVLKQKMVILQDLLSTLIRASDSSWKVTEMKSESEQSSQAFKYVHLILPSIPSQQEEGFSPH